MNEFNENGNSNNFNNHDLIGYCTNCGKEIFDNNHFFEYSASEQVGEGGNTNNFYIQKQSPNNESEGIAKNAVRTGANQLAASAVNRTVDTLFKNKTKNRITQGSYLQCINCYRSWIEDIKMQKKWDFYFLIMLIFPFFFHLVLYLIFFRVDKIGSLGFKNLAIIFSLMISWFVIPLFINLIFLGLRRNVEDREKAVRVYN